MIDVTAIRQRYLSLSAHLDERARRIFAATEARTAGYGGIAAVSRATGIAASTIGRGLAELSTTDQLAPDRVRRPGGGGKKLVEKDPTRLADLMAMVEPDACGDPMSPLRWTCKSLSQLASALAAMGHKIGRSAVGDLLHQQNFSLLGQVAERGAVMLDMACRQCPREGRLQMARLLAEHGPPGPMPALRDLLAADCPRRTSVSFAEQCQGVHFPQLFELFWKSPGS